MRSNLWASGYYFYFFFNDTATTEIYTLSLHDALPICRERQHADWHACPMAGEAVISTICRHFSRHSRRHTDRKSTRLNSSHPVNSYAVFCLKKIRTFAAFTQEHDTTHELRHYVQMHAT